ncbi:ATP-binding protein [Silvimonas amylolytica]|uniref:histidine kinase n=1 Tax=Silvimonas amylolytica TaxID=449663 RepID=A0ABQ2PGM2_9NEIS|nr:transporter substrate-binding domain-containing protein [Silvimonas amylolytica]GGP24421.1 hybrid sensor histidine kinase/response regulator [Silvimonas amylolytica]
MGTFPHHWLTTLWLALALWGLPCTSPADAAASQARTVIVGTLPNLLPPLDIQLAGDRPDGISADLIKDIAARNHWQLEFRPFSSAHSQLQALATGQIDIATSAAQALEPDPALAYGAPYYTGRLVVVTRKNRSATAPLSQVAFSPTSTPPERLRALAGQRRLQIQPYANDPEALEAVALGQADAYIGDNGVAFWLIRLLNLANLSIAFYADEQPNQFHLVTRASDATLRNAIDKQIDKQGNDASFGKQLAWLSVATPDTPEQPLTLTPEEKRWIQQHPVAHYSTLPDLIPFYYKTPHGKPQGLVVDLLERVTRQTGLKFEPLERANLKDIKQDNLGGKSDIALFMRAIDQEGAWRKTHTYAHQLFVLVGRTNSRACANNLTPRDTVGYLGTETGSTTFTRQFPKYKLQAVPTVSGLLDAVQSGDLHCALIDISVANYMIGQFYADTLTIQSAPEPLPTLIGFGVTSTEPLLSSILNKAILSLPADYAARWKDQWLSGGSPEPTFNRYRTRAFWILSIGLTVSLGAAIWGGILWREVRRRRKAEQKLQDMLIRDQQLFNSIPMAMFYADTAGKFTAGNGAWIAATGLKNRTTAGLDITGLPVTGEPSIRTLIDSGDHPEYSLTDLKARLNGEIRDLYFWLTRFEDGKGSNAGIAGGWLDISERVRLEHELRLARDEAARSNQVKSIFLAGMSHEIRTPLSIAASIIELRLDDEKNATAREQLETAQTAIAHLLALIDEILDLSRIESETLKLRPDQVYLAQTIKDLIEQFTARARQKGIGFICNYQNCDLLISIDPVRLRQILTNLISNAIKFTNSGNVSFHADLAMEEHKSTALLHLEVSDTGIGIPLAEQGMLFEPFYRASTPGRQIYEGTGLGLALTRQLILAMQGQITFESVPHQGTTFAVTLPVSVKPPTSSEAQADTNNDAFWFPGLRALLVDDHPANRLIVRSQLEPYGVSMTEAEDGFTALDLLTNNQFDLIILDYTMPLISGSQVARAIRQRESAQNTNTPIIGMTASLQDEIREDALHAGMNECVVRPVSMSTWRKLLKTWCWPMMDQRPTFIPRSSAGYDEPAILSALTQTLPADINTANQSVRLRNVRQLAETIHRIKGPFKMIGQAEIVDICEELEAGCTNDPDFADLQTALRRLDRILQEFMKLHALDSNRDNPS